MNAVTTRRTGSLTAAADEINREHELALRHRDTAVQHAIKCGELLRAQKLRMKQGDFRAWIEENCDFAQSTASRYMLAAKRNATGVAFSSLQSLFPSGRPAIPHACKGY